MHSLYKYDPDTDCLLCARFWVSGKSVMYSSGRYGSGVPPVVQERLRLPHEDSAHDVLQENVIPEYLEDGWWESLEPALDEMEAWRGEVDLDCRGASEFDADAFILYCPLCGGPLHHHRDVPSDNSNSVSAEASCLRCGTRILGMTLSWAPPRVEHLDHEFTGIDEW